MPATPIVADTNLFINALAGRGPPVLRAWLDAAPRVFVAAPTRAELAWISGRLDPAHPESARALAVYTRQLAHIDPAKVLVPDDRAWMQAGALAGAAARALAGGGLRIATAFDRVDLINDALIAILAHEAGLTVVTADSDFEVLAQLVPGLAVLFYEATPRTQ